MFTRVRNKRWAVILGARPNFVKAAPFFRQAKNYPQFEFVGIHTGQHADPSMSKVFFDELGIPVPAISLTIKGESHTERIGKMFDKLKEVFKQHKFAGVVVFGDVNSTLAGALAAAKYAIPLVHIEAGLRSHDRRMPEEINRVIVDHLASLLFASEPAAAHNLRCEGVKEKKICLGGNIMIESLELYKDKIDTASVVQTFNLVPKRYVVATIHRQENTDSEYILKQALQSLRPIQEKYQIIFPVHPGTRKRISEFGLDSLIADIQVIEPVGYFEFIKLVKESRGVVTDSGGIQEETSHLGIPCATLRDNTERPITLELGSNKLFSIFEPDPADMLAHLERGDFKSRHIPLWDGGVSQRIFAALETLTS